MNPDAIEPNYDEIAAEYESRDRATRKVWVLNNGGKPPGKTSPHRELHRYIIALAIVTELPYLEAGEIIRPHLKQTRRTIRYNLKKLEQSLSAPEIREGFKDAMAKIGAPYTRLSPPHLRGTLIMPSKLPPGKIIVNLCSTYVAAAVVDHTVHSSFNPFITQKDMLQRWRVLGYWSEPPLIA